MQTTVIVSDNNIKPVRVMHLVSSEGVTGAAQQALFMPMLTRMPKARVKALVVALSPNVVPSAVLRQNGVPVYDVALSKRRFSLGAFSQLLKAVRTFRPDVIQAWGHTAQVASHWLRGRCKWDVKLVWTVANTAPLSRQAGFIDRQKLQYAARLSRGVDRIVYASEAAASAHRRAGFPEEGYEIVPLGVDPTRFKPDFATRRKIREQLGLPPEAFVIGMMAPFQPEYDHATLLKAVGELIKTNPNVNVLLAGHGVQKGNAPLMALVGGGTLGTRTQLLGEWSDLASFFNACDLACSSALTDNARMSLVVAMLCGIPCVATGMGAQGEVIGQFGIAVEPGNPTALIRGITRILQMPPEKRVQMAQGARKHALASFVAIRSLQKYLQLYYDLVGRKLAAATAVPAPQIDASIPAPKPEDQEPQKPVAKPKSNRTVGMYDLSDPDSLEARDSTAAQAPVLRPSEGDVLQIFEASIAQQPTMSVSPALERARGVTEEHEDLLAPEALQSGRHAAPKPAAAPSVAAAVEAPLALAASAANPEPLKPTPTESSAGKEELSLADTITASGQISLEATTTLEIPPEMIFSTATTQKAPPTPNESQASAALPSPSVAPRDESKPAPNPQQPVAVPIEAKVELAEMHVRPDSATVPALAIDALLSSVEAGSSTSPSPGDALQLDLLGDQPELKIAAGDS